MKHIILYLAALVLTVLTVHAAENVNRGVVLLPRSGGDVYIGWRYLLQDQPSTGFNVYRSTSSTGTYKKLNGTLITGSTNYVDGSAAAGTKYYYKVVTVNSGTEGAASSPAGITAASSASYKKGFATKAVGGIQRICTGDVNGDGYLDIAVLWPRENKDPYYGGIWNASTNPCTDTYKLSMYLHDGTFLWTYDLGWGIELGIHYSPFTLWDIDNDGKAEVILKTNKSSNPLDYSQEYLTVLNGMTKAVKKETRWIDAPSGFSKTDLQKYNNNSRNHIGIAYLDGKTPSIIVGRGTYQETKITAFTPNLVRQWERNLSPTADGRSSHGMEVMDADGDGKDEIFWGDVTLNPNGTIKWKAPLYRGHPDLLVVADIMPSHPGYEVFYGREGWGGTVQSTIGNLVLDAKTGAVIWKDMNHIHVHTGMLGNFSTKSDGMEIYTGYEKDADPPMGPFTYKCTGELINHNVINGFPVQWDGSGIKKLYEWGTGYLVNYDTKAKTFVGKGTDVGRGPIIADIWGDYREEIICPESATSNRVAIYTNYAENNARKISCLLDMKYREAMARTGMQYNRQCLPGGYYFGTPAADNTAPSPTGMTIPEKTKIMVTFDEGVTAATAAKASNYSVNNGITVSAAALNADGSSVTLTVSAMTSGIKYTVTVAHIADAAGNVMSAAKTVSATYTQQLVEGFATAGTGTYVWTTLATGKKMYIDRDYTYSASPAVMNGRALLQTAMDDKTASASDVDFIGFKVTEGATVYVLYTPLNATLESAWLNSAHGWAVEGYTVATTVPGDGEADRKVAKKFFAAGSTVNLGGHGATSPTTSMYTVVVVPGQTTGISDMFMVRQPAVHGLDGMLFDQQGRRVISSVATPGVYFQYENGTLVKRVRTGLQD